MFLFCLVNLNDLVDTVQSKIKKTSDVLKEIDREIKKFDRDNPNSTLAQVKQNQYSSCMFKFKVTNYPRTKIISV